MVVATAHTARGLRQAARLRAGGGIDLVEIRLDSLALRGKKLETAVAKIRLPLILTARHAREGGAAKMTDSERAALLNSLLPLAAFVDIEERSARAMKDVLARAKKAKVQVIVSFHDFTRTPRAARLQAIVRSAKQVGAGIVKIAATLRGPADLAALILLQAKSDNLATMGMGTLGKVSRLVLPSAGSRLVYGYLDRPQVDGQWVAPLLAKRLHELKK